MNSAPNVELARFNMIEQQIRPWDVLDPVVLDALARLRREEFVAPVYRSMAFVDAELPLPAGTAKAEAMLAPKVEARLMQEAVLAEGDTVLEIGAGSGYMAALLAQRARNVVTLEIDAALADFAAANLARAGIHNVSVRHADGARGLAAEAPFDAVVLSGSVPSVPDDLLAQLKPGGRLVAIVGQLPIMRAVRITRSGAQTFGTLELFDTVAPRLHGFGEPTRFRF
jgi:protein-L-isoaspartate(D-aspartate) O-methyltransferase